MKKLIWILLFFAYLGFSAYILLLDKFHLLKVGLDGRFKLLWLLGITIVVFLLMFFMTKVFDLFEKKGRKGKQ
ncbi:MAG: hypothetical protein JXR48_05120 [Candidatus Delongbacteria bacterium]|nr:hypothetical protein [Candidatus Delongbacteria bacterium]MBN2834330.1 hypothetical protein [Candidatus Delongbacteria bacterium]